MLDGYDLNARHVSTAVWLGVFLALGLMMSPSARLSLRDLVPRTLNKTVVSLLAGLCLVAAASTLCAVIVGDMISYWLALPIVTASVWTVTSGVTILTNYGKFARREETIPRTVRRVLLPPVLLAALVGSSTLSLTLELILVPVVFAVGTLYVVCRSDEQYQSIGNVASALLLFYVAAMLALLIRDSLDDIKALQMASHAVVLPVWLTLWTVPYLRLLIAWERSRFVRSAPRKVIRRGDYGEDWPLTIETATLRCKQSGVWVESKGKKYALNGRAKALLPVYGIDLLELEDNWRESPESERLREALGHEEGFVPWRVSVLGLVQDGLALEEGG